MFWDDESDEELQAGEASTFAIPIFFVDLDEGSPLREPMLSTKVPYARVPLSAAPSQGTMAFMVSRDESSISLPPGVSSSSFHPLPTHGAAPHRSSDFFEVAQRSYNRIQKNGN